MMTMPLVVTAVRPTEAAERLHALDVLRGLALFGMILVHFHQKTRRDASGLEDLIGWGVWVLVEQKAWATFAFLFGAGFAILLRRLERRGAPVAAIYLRRLAMLAVFGVVADVAFGFHILFEYACWGFVLLVVRRWSTRTLLFAAALSACTRPVAAEASAIHAWWTSTPLPAVTTSPLAEAVEAAARQHSYLILLSARWSSFIGTFPTSWRGILPDTNLALFILGLLAVRHGILDDPKRHVRLIAGWMTFGAAAWACAWLVLRKLPPVSMPGARWPLEFGLGLVQDQWLCFTYIGAIVLLLAFRPAWTARLAVFGFAGRMALTNYLVQAAALDALSSGYGADLKLRPYVYSLAAVLLFAAEAATSRAWLARYRFGPLEWLWRTVTYARVQTLSA
ncbi:MAG TPA: DUF418 domain-containing protein [Vicinamibacterales bacterium]|jgi:uncharacterized protein|nr:DUF418 domain-containing protein [Vicinamibacterales bacterium]